MLHRKSLVVSVLILFCLVAAGKDKKKNLLPADILRARTVLVMVDPEAGVEVRDPNANRDARRDVENALAKWGRFDPVQDGYTADLIIVIRKGHDQLAEPTIGGTRVNNNPPVMGQQTDTGISGAGHTGSSGFPGDASSNGQSSSSRPYPQTEVGFSQDMFVVYRGSPGTPAYAGKNPLDTPPVWRYTATTDGLASPFVPAVNAFRKLVADSEKELAGKP